MTDHELMEQFQLILQGMTDMESRMDKKIDGVRQEVADVRQEVADARQEVADVRQEVADVRQEVKASEARTKVFIENTVSKRIDALFDGYKLTHEKQWELERETQRLQEQVNDLQTRLEALEKKISA